ncbi:MAG: FkbM family methyltransferase [Rikenellaceae bacterium]
MNRFIHRLLYRALPLPLYFRVVSGLLFLSVRLGFGRFSAATEYIFHLPKLIDRGGVAIDIGANLGYYSLPLSTIVGNKGRVYSVEPVPIIFDILRQNLRGRDNVELLNIALGCEECEITMSNDSVATNGYFGTGQNGVGKGSSEGAIEFSAQMKRGSELFGGLERLDLIKCDIEGYEMVVIPEIRSIIERHKPTVLIETGGENRSQIVKIFREMNYSAYTLERGCEVAYNPKNDNHKDLIFRCE